MKRPQVCCTAAQSSTESLFPIFFLEKVWCVGILFLTLCTQKKIFGFYRIKDNRTRLHPGDLQAGHFLLNEYE